MKQVIEVNETNERKIDINPAISASRLIKHFYPYQSRSKYSAKKWIEIKQYIIKMVSHLIQLISIKIFLIIF